MASIQSLEEFSIEDEEESEDEEGSSVSNDEETSSEDESPEEPLLKYKRFAKEVVNSLSQGEDGVTKNVIMCMAVHSKFIALGTYDGTVKLLDHSGTVLIDREYALHGGQVNQISVDEEGEVMACCSDDGKVIIVGLFTSKYNNSVQFDKAIKSVAIHPHYIKAANRVFAAGSDKLQLVDERRWPLIGHRITDIHQGYGIISTIKWRDCFIAFANEKAVFVYDVSVKETISFIKFDEVSPTYLPSSLCWVKNGLLLIGRGHLVKVAEVKEGDSIDFIDYSGGFDPLAKKKRRMAIVAQNTFPEFLVCGVVPVKFQNATEWNMVVLGYDANVNQEEAILEGAVPPPHLLVVPAGKYSPEEEEFQTVTELTRDKLLPRGYSYCRCHEYHLECVITGSEDRFYILTPIDIILAQKTDANDHIDFLIRKRQFKEAMQFVENPINIKMLRPAKVKETGLLYIYHLIKKARFSEAARKCHDFLGPADRQRWEDVIYHFLEHHHLPVILPFIPKSNPKLSQAMYETVLNYFLLYDAKTLYEVIQEWPTDLYNSAVIMNAVTDQLKKEPNDINLLKVKAKLFEDSGDSDSALEIYLRLGDVEVFDLIHKRKLHNALIENIQYLMKLGENQLQKTAELLVEFRQDDCLPPTKVVKKLDSVGSEKEWEYFLHRYLDTLFDRDPKAGSEYHERQVQLYADYDQKKLLPFLRACNDIPLQKALDVCQSRNLYEAMVFLLDRMGNPQAALQNIVGNLKDVDKAIVFVREKDDEELWDSLIQLSKNHPEFITGLLQNAGTHIDPTKLIKEIPDRLKINNLGLSLVKLLNDYQLQVNLREGCKKILVKDSHKLMEKLHRLNRRAVSFDNLTACLNCSGEMLPGDYSKIVIFFCGHMVHQNCSFI